MKTATFIDFDDSFTFNVIQELVSIGLEVKLLHWMDFEELPKTDFLILGPGPGHPDDYQRIFPLIARWIEEGRSLFGICLGHQIYWRLQGEEVIQSKEPLHGQKICLSLSEDWQQYLRLPQQVWVQRYNSLAVMGQSAYRAPFTRNLISEGEIVITRGPRLLTYQFHPESMGTSYRRSFFLPLLRDLV